MKIILLTTEDCSICADAEKGFMKEFFKEIAAGEAEIVNLDKDEKAQEMFVNNELPLAPVVIIMTAKERVIANIDATDFLEDLKKAGPPGNTGDKAPVESSG